MRLLIVNGPNLNLLGTREPDIYGSETLSDLERTWNERAARYGAHLETFQSNHEGAIVDVIQQRAGDVDGLIINAAALTHTSRSIPDAISATRIPTVEVHLSNIYEREPWRAVSFISPVADHVIYGRGAVGYLHAIDHLAAHIGWAPHRASYGDDPDQFFDIRVPDTDGPVPAVVIIHGGFWRDLWLRDTIEPLVVDLSDHVATINVEYRRGAGSYPASVEDIGAAIDHLIAIAPAHNIDAGRIVVTGHSAGGYLALRMAEERDDLKHVVAVAPTADLDAVARQYGAGNPASLYLGGDPDDATGVWQAARLNRSPRTPVTIIHGLDDESVPVDHARWYADGEHPLVDVHEIPGADHFAVIDPLSPAGMPVRNAILGDVSGR